MHTYKNKLPLTVLLKCEIADECCIRRCFETMWIKTVVSFVNIVKSKACLNIYTDVAFQGL